MAAMVLKGNYWAFDSQEPTPVRHSSRSWGEATKVKMKKHLIQIGKRYAANKNLQSTNIIKYMAQAFRREKKHNQIDVATF